MSLRYKNINRFNVATPAIRISAVIIIIIIASVFFVNASSDEIALSSNQNDDNGKANPAAIENYLKATSSFLDKHQSEAALKSKLTTESIRMATSYHALPNHQQQQDPRALKPTGFHVESYHSSSGFFGNNNQSMHNGQQRMHPKFFDVDADLDGLIPVNAANADLRCEVSSSSPSSSSLFKITLAFTSPEKAAKALKKFDGASFKFLRPDDHAARNLASIRVPFSVAGCNQNNNQKKMRLVALSASTLSSTRLHIVARGALPHEALSLNTEGGFKMHPIVHPSTLPSNMLRGHPNNDGHHQDAPSEQHSHRSAEALSSTVEIVSPFSSSIRYTSNTAVDIIFTVASSCDLTKPPELWSDVFGSDNKIATAKLKSDRKFTYTTSSGNGDMELYISVECVGSSWLNPYPDYESNRIEIVWVNPSSPDEPMIHKPIPWSMHSRDDMITLSLYAKSGQGKSNSKGEKTVRLYRAGWLYGSDFIKEYSVDLSGKNPTVTIDPATIPSSSSLVSPQYFFRIWENSIECSGVGGVGGSWSFCLASEYFFIESDYTKSVNQPTEKTAFSASCSSCSTVGQSFCSLCNYLDAGSLSASLKYSVVGSLDAKLQAYHWDVYGDYVFQGEGDLDADISVAAAFEITGFQKTFKVPLAVPAPSLDIEKELPIVGDFVLEAKIGIMEITLDGAIQADATFRMNQRRVVTIARSNFVPLTSSGVEVVVAQSSKGGKPIPPTFDVKGKVNVALTVTLPLTVDIELGSYYARSSASGFIKGAIVAKYPPFEGSSSAVETACRSKHYLQLTPTAGYVFDGYSYSLPYYGQYSSKPSGKTITLNSIPKCWFAQQTAAPKQRVFVRVDSTSNLERTLVNLRMKLASKLSLPLGSILATLSSSSSSSDQGRSAVALSDDNVYQYDIEVAPSMSGSSSVSTVASSSLSSQLSSVSGQSINGNTVSTSAFTPAPTPVPAQGGSPPSPPSPSFSPPSNSGPVPPSSPQNPPPPPSSPNNNNNNNNNNNGGAAPPGPSPQNEEPSLAGPIVGGLLGSLFLVGGVVYYVVVYRPKQQQQQNTEGGAVDSSPSASAYNMPINSLDNDDARQEAMLFATATAGSNQNIQDDDDNNKNATELTVVENTYKPPIDSETI